ncbi:MAG: hypothetical protein HN731_02195 [Rhodospirillaceae bacterium]|jgi:hypothetical protein|nr:hypothetical protein [Rhodospirillaceae bacterium]MBT5938318.1 hypothetical protein [Rhodospirillaceae bacterium]MBT7953973.1 hypothetical protein [Rhodospirillaceae bacterium]
MSGSMFRLAPPLFILVFGIIFLTWSYSYDESAQQVPVLVGWSLVVLCVLDVIASSGTKIGDGVKAFFTGTIVGEGSFDLSSQPLPKVLVAMAWPIAFVTCVYFFGFVLVIPFYVFLFVTLQGKKPVKTGAIAAVIATAFTWIVFELLMNYDVYQGIIFAE